MISQELFDELQERYAQNNKRVEVFAVTDEGIMEFLHSFLSPKDAYKYCESHSALHPDRYREYLFGNLQAMEQGKHSTYRRVTNGY